MKNPTRRLFSGLMSLLMLFSTCSSLFMSAAAATNNQQQIEAAGDTKTEHGVTISKIITPTEEENYFDITLTATDTQTTDENSIDVVLVMDISNTMNNNNRLVNAKAAAWAFVQAFGSSQNLSYNRRVGLVTFNSDANIVLDLQYPNQSMQGTISSIVAPGRESSRRFTNVEGGLLLARKMLQTSDTKAEHKFVVLITDGFPTTYTQTQGQRTMTGYDTQARYFTDYEKGIKCDGTDYSDLSAQAAENVAKTLKNTDGVNVISIGVDIGGQTIQTYIDNFKNNPNVSTVERAKGVHPNYVIGKADDPDGYQSWLRSEVGGGPLLKGNLSSYYSGDSAQDLTTAFNNILSTIEMTTTHSMVNPKFASDPMGNHIEFLGFYDKNGNLDADHSLVGTRTLNGENTASYTSKINWDLSKSGYTVTQVNSNTTQFTYTLKYRVRLENELLNFVEHQDYDTNGKTTLTFDTPDGEEETIEYPMPEVEGYLGSFSFTKTNGLTGNDQKALSGAQFKLSHKGASCSVCKSAGKTVTIADQNVTSGSDGKVEFTRIPSGHDYTLTETKPPLGYVKDTTVYQIGVHYDTVTLNGTAMADGSMGTVANTALDPVSVTFAGTKTMDGKAPAADVFTFELRDRDGNKISTTKNKADGTFAFGPVSFDSVGTYVYEIVEIDSNDLDIIYDRSIYHVTVNVTVDNEANPTKLVATSTYRNHSTGSTHSAADFSNTSRQSAVVYLKAHKTLDGNRPLADKEFAFELLNKDKEVLETIRNDINGDVVFSGISLSDAGTFTYYIREKIPTGSDMDDHIDYDETLWQVTVVVKADDANPVYNATVTYTNLSDNATGDKAAFTNKLDELPDDNVTFFFTKTDHEKKPLNGIEFKLSHDPSCCSDMGQAPYLSKNETSNENGVVTFEEVPSGHYYILEEVTLHADYLHAEDRHVAILYGVAYIDGVPVQSASSVTIQNVPSDRARLILAAEKNMDGQPALGYDGQFSFSLYQKDSSTPIDAQSNLSTNENGILLSEVIFDPIYFEYDGIYYYKIEENRGSNPSIVYDTTTRYITVVVEGTKDKTCTCTDAKCTAASANSSCEACKLGHINCTYVPPVCECETHCTAAPEESVCKVCHKDHTQCKIAAPECDCSVKCAEGNVNENCPVCGNAQDLTVCTGAVPTPTCSCTTKCTAQEKNGECPVCGSAEDLSVCTAAAEQPVQPTCSCETHCSEEAKNEECAVCNADVTKCRITAPGESPVSTASAGPAGTGEDTNPPTVEGSDPADGDGSSSGASTSGPKVTVYVSTKGYYVPDGDMPASDYSQYNGSSSIVFNNKSRQPVEVQLKATKAMSGNDTVGTHTFQLLDADRHVLQTKQNVGSSVTFDPISYSAVATHTYYIVEVVGDDPHMAYDTTEHKVTVDVTAPATSDSYAAAVTYGSSTTPPVFTNRILTMMVLNKVDETGNPMAGAEFTLKHAGNCCQETIENITSVSQDDGELVLSGIISGHTYILEETKPRDGYVPAPDHRVVVSNGIIAVYDKDASENWTPVTLEEGVHHVIPNYPVAKVELAGNKVMIGMDLIGDDYAFELLDSSKQVLQTVKNDASGMFTFEALEFDHTHEGTHTYYIREKLPAQADRNPGITYDETIYKVTIVVTVSKDNQVSTETTITPETADGISAQSAEGVVFTNTYSINGDVTVKLAGKKLLDSGAYNRTLKMNEFYFSIYLADSNYNIVSAPIRTLSNGTRNDPDAAENPEVIEFADRTYTTQGDFHYVILEHDTGLGGITYDTARYHMHTKVADNGKGGLMATVTLKNTKTGDINTFTSTELSTDADGRQHAQVDATGASGVSFQFNNSYEPKGPAQYVFQGNKILTVESGTKTLNAGDFEFAMFETDSSFEVDDNATPIETVTNRADGTFAFTALRFDTLDTTSEANNLYYYVVKEVEGTEAGITYDDTIYKLTLKVEDDGAGKLIVKAGINGTDPDQENTGDTGVLPETPIEFKNTFSDKDLVKVNLSGKKYITGMKLEGGDFTFRLYETGSSFQVNAAAKLLEETTNTASGAYAFSTLYYGEHDVGRYFYLVQEVSEDVLGMTYDKSVYQITVTVERLPSGNLGVTKSVKKVNGNTFSNSTVDKLDFTNRYVSPEITVPINVVKTVKNISSGTAKPQGFKFQLVDQDGNKQTVTTNASGKASFALTFDEDDIGKTYTYTLTEVDTKQKHFTYDKTVYEFEISIRLNSQDKIVATILKDGTRVTTASGSFENIYRGKKDYSPKTGDESNITLYLATMGGSFTLLAAAFFIYQHTKSKYKPKYTR